MEKFKKYTDTLYKKCTELIHSIACDKNKFRMIYSSSTQAFFEDRKHRSVAISSTELSLKKDDISVYYRDNIVQFCTNGISYMDDVVYIPIFYDYSFYKLCTEDDMFQLSTLIDIKNITLVDICNLNRIRDYFDFQYLKNNV